MKCQPLRQWLYCLLLSWVVAWAVVASPLARADERILSFHSDIQIAADASLQVKETIRIRAEGINIHRGIYRDFPTTYRDRAGNAYRVRFNVTEVTRDGQPESWKLQRRTNGVRIVIGETLLAVPAVYDYTISYHTSRQLGYFATHDELYWNVTGNGWSFPIDDASATVSLPQPVAAAQLGMEGYTGPFRARGQDYTTGLSEGEGSIRTTRELPVNNGLTLVMSWPKGIVHQPDQVERAVNLVEDNRGVLLALLTLLGVAFYLAAAWSKVGRDPPAGVIFPQYEPPADMSPATARYLVFMRYDNKGLTAAIVNLAVQGYLHITQEGSKYRLERNKPGQTASSDETAVYQQLFVHAETVSLDNKNYALVGAAQSAQRKALKTVCEGQYFLSNSLYLWPSLLASMVMFMVIVVMHAVVPLVIVSFVFIFVLHMVFAWLLKAPTPAGRLLLDQLAGFKLYMEVAEKDALNLRNPPQMTALLFERFLPYAIALGVEASWAAKFERALAALHGNQATAYSPLWYTGNFNALHMTTFTNGLSSSFNAAISSAAVPPGSASGGGGGGFSGGGGGGGGGGGH